MPEFSIIVPCYNGAKFLPAALESVLAQAGDADIEIIVVDDGSRDGSADVAAGYPGVTVLRQANAGVSVARNLGIERAAGRFLIFLDSDDALRPGMLAAARRAIAGDQGIDVLHGVADVVDADAREVLGEYGGRDLSGDAFHSLLRSNDGPPNTFVVRREAVVRAGAFDPRLRACEDWDLWLRIAANGARFALVPQLRAVYRVTPGSLSKNVEYMWRGGRIVMHRTRCLRPGCALCRQARAEGLAGLALSMRPLLRDIVKSPGGVAQAVRLLLRNPSLLGWQLYWQARRSFG